MKMKKLHNRFVVYPFLLQLSLKKSILSNSGKLRIEMNPCESSYCMTLLSEYEFMGINSDCVYILPLVNFFMIRKKDSVNKFDFEIIHPRNRDFKAYYELLKQIGPSLYSIDFDKKNPPTPEDILQLVEEHKKKCLQILKSLCVFL